MTAWPREFNSGLIRFKSWLPTFKSVLTKKDEATIEFPDEWHILAPRHIQKPVDFESSYSVRTLRHPRREIHQIMRNDKQFAI